MVDANLYQTLFTALRTRDENELAKAAFELLHMPIVASDAAFVVIAKYPTARLGDEQWDANRIGHQIEPRFLETFREDDHFTKYPSTSRPILIDWGHYEHTPRLTSVIRSEDAVVGFISALTTGHVVEEWHYEALEAIAEAFSILSETEFGTRSRHLDFSTAFLYGLLTGTVNGEFASLRTLFVQQIGGPYQLLCAKTRTQFETLPESALKRALEANFETFVQVAYQGTLYVLVDGAAQRPDKSSGDVLRALEIPHVTWGVSRTFQDLSEFPECRWQAEGALRVGSVIEPDKSVHVFDELVADVVLDEVTSRVPLRCAEPAALAALRAHDAENGTEYFATLECYLLNRGDRKATAAALHVHRNTLAYRLDRIEEMIGSTESDAYTSIYFALARHASAMGDRGGAKIGAFGAHGGDAREEEARDER